MEMDGINFVSSDEIIKDVMKQTLSHFIRIFLLTLLLNCISFEKRYVSCLFRGVQKATLNDFIKHLFKSQPTIQMINQKFYEVSNRVIGILSLTSKNDNLLMWVHYANSHKGFVVEFNIENVFFNQTVRAGEILRHT